MRRLARLLFALCSATSLLLCVAVCVLWARSYRVADVIEGRRKNPDRQSMSLSLSSGGGLFVSRGWSHNRVSAEYRYQTAGIPAGRGRWRHRTSVPVRGFPAAAASPRDRRWAALGFTFITRGDAWPDLKTDYRAVHFPLWWLALATAILPGAYLVVLRRAKARRQPGACPACGYDLRASPDHCPECGLARCGA